MLDDAEYDAVVVQPMKAAAIACGDDAVRWREHYDRLVVEAHERLTGVHINDPLEITRHAISAWGPPCEHCGKPLRTKTARFCGCCMKPVSSP
jgi:hypothetical protein